MEGKTEYSKQELKDIFDIVNSQYLHLKGKEKTISKNQFVNVWKQNNKSLSAYELMIHLYKAEAINDAKNEFLEKFMEDTGLTVDEVKSKKPIPYRKYISRLRRKDEEIEYLENEFDNMMESKDLIYKTDHDNEMKEQKQKYKQELAEKDDEIKKLEMKVTLINSDASARVNRLEQQAEYYKKELEKLTAE